MNDLSTLRWVIGICFPVYISLQKQLLSITSHQAIDLIDSAYYSRNTATPLIHKFSILSLRPADRFSILKHFQQSHQADYKEYQWAIDLIRSTIRENHRINTIIR